MRHISPKQDKESMGNNNGQPKHQTEWPLPETKFCKLNKNQNYRNEMDTDSSIQVCQR